MSQNKNLKKNDKKSRFIRISKVLGYILLSLFLYFWSVGILRTFIKYLQSNDAAMGFPMPFIFFISSFAAGIFIIAIFIKHFSKHYLYCHELTHALFGVLTGSKVSELKINKESASINVSHPNIVVVLSPYIISLHVLLVLFIYGCFTIAFPNCGNISHNFFTILVGLAASFHFVFTIKSLMQEQTDIERFGFFISYLIITALNLAGAMTIFTCIDEISFGDFIKTSFSFTFDSITKLWTAIF